MFPRRWMLPSLHKSDLFRDMDLFKEKDSEVIRLKEDADQLEVSLDTSQYRPDELRVSVAGREVCVEGRHEEKSEDGTRMVARQFVRRFVFSFILIYAKGPAYQFLLGMFDKERLFRSHVEGYLYSIFL
jgi:HSP20 family molecular chaperone IbpA